MHVHYAECFTITVDVVRYDDLLPFNLFQYLNISPVGLASDGKLQSTVFCYQSTNLSPLKGEFQVVQPVQTGPVAKDNIGCCSVPVWTHLKWKTQK